MCGSSKKEETKGVNKPTKHSKKKETKGVKKPAKHSKKEETKGVKKPAKHSKKEETKGIKKPAKEDTKGFKTPAKHKTLVCTLRTQRLFEYVKKTLNSKKPIQQDTKQQEIYTARKLKTKNKQSPRFE